MLEKQNVCKIRLDELFSSKVKSNLGCKYALEIRSLLVLNIDNKIFHLIKMSFIYHSKL